MLKLKKHYERKSDEELRALRKEYAAELAKKNAELEDYENRLGVLKDDYVKLRDADERYDAYERQLLARLDQLHSELPADDLATLHGSPREHARAVLQEITRLEQGGLDLVDKTLHETWRRVAPMLDRMKDYEEKVSRLREHVTDLHAEIEKIDKELFNRIPSQLREGGGGE